MSNYKDFAPWAAGVVSGGGSLIQIREDNKTAQIPYKLFGGQTKSFHIISPKGCVIEYSEDGVDWKYLTYDGQSRFFEATNALYLNGTPLTEIKKLENILDWPAIFPHTEAKGCVVDNYGNFLVLSDDGGSDVQMYKRNPSEGDTDWISNFYTDNTAGLTNDTFHPDAVFATQIGLAYDRNTEEFMSMSSTGNTCRYFKIGGGAPTNHPVNTAGTFNFRGYCIYAGDLYAYNATDTTIYRFSGKTDTIVETLDLTPVVGASGQWAAFDFDHKGNLILLYSTSSTSTSKLYLLDGFTTTVIHSVYGTLADGSGNSSLCYDPITRWLIGFSMDSSTKRIVESSIISSVDIPCALLSESE